MLEAPGTAAIWADKSAAALRLTGKPQPLRKCVGHLFQPGGGGPCFCDIEQIMKSAQRGKEIPVNSRKEIDYSTLFSILDALMSKGLTQMELYQKIGTAVCSRPEKGAAAGAAEYLQKNYPDTAGFSPRNVRRMREFCRTYQSNPDLLSEAAKIGWTQNVVILEQCETEEERRWYIQAVQQFGWSKQQLIQEIVDSAHTKKVLDNTSEVCYNEDEINSYAERAEETPVQDMERPVAQNNAADNRADAINRANDTSYGKLCIHLVPKNKASKVYDSYTPIQYNLHLQNETQRKTASVGHCHSPP